MLILKNEQEFPCFYNGHIHIISELDDPNNIIISPCCYYNIWNSKHIKINIHEIDEFFFDNLVYLKQQFNIKTNKICKLGIKPNHTFDDNKKYYCNAKNYPLKRIHISVSRACNLRCKMCYGDKTKYNEKDLQNEYVNKILYFKLLNLIKNHNLDNITLTGSGEPFFYKKETLDYLKNLNPINDTKEVTIISNLTLLNDDDIYLLDKIHKNGINFYIIASIDGITAEVYKKIRNNNLFDKVMHNAELMKNLNLLNQVNFVYQDDNKHELNSAKQFWENKNILFNKIPCDYWNG